MFLLEIDHSLLKQGRTILHRLFGRGGAGPDRLDRLVEWRPHRSDEFGVGHRPAVGGLGDEAGDDWIVLDLFLGFECSPAPAY